MTAKDYYTIVPSAIRKSIHQKNYREGYKYPYTIVTIKLLNSYPIKYSYYTLDTLKQMYKDYKYKSALIAIRHIEGKDIPERKSEHNQTQSYVSHYTKSTNYTKYRYLRFISHNDLAKGKVLMGRQIVKYCDYILERELEYKHRTKFAKLLSKLNGKRTQANIAFIKRCEDNLDNPTYNWSSFKTTRLMYKKLKHY